MYINKITSILNVLGILIVSLLVNNCAINKSIYESNISEYATINVQGSWSHIASRSGDISILKIKRINGKEVNVGSMNYATVVPGMVIVDLFCQGTTSDGNVTVKYDVLKSHRYIIYLRWDCNEIWIRDSTANFEERLEFY